MSPSSFCGVEPATNLLVHGRDRGIKGLRDQGEDPDHSVPTCAGGWARTGALRPSAVRGASQGTAPCIASRTPRGFAGGALPVLRGRGAACCTPWAGDSSRVAVRGTGRRRRAPLKVDFAARRPLYRGGRSRGRSDRRRRPDVFGCQRPRAFTGAAGRRGEIGGEVDTLRRRSHEAAPPRIASVALRPGGVVSGP